MLDNDVPTRPCTVSTGHRMERRRALPPWMSTKMEKEEEPLKSRRKRKVARAVFYCMNETELVEAAVSCLTDVACEDVTTPVDHQAAMEARDITAKKQKTASFKTHTKAVTEVLEEDSSDCGESQENTYVSETDLDITEVETLPYTRSPQHQRPEGLTSGPVQDCSSVINGKLDAEKTEECPQEKADAAEEDDALKLVREIFFT